MSETNYPLKGKSVFGDRLVRDGNKIVFGPNERPDIGKPGALYRTVGVNSFDGLGNVVGKNVIRDYHEIEDIYKTLKIMGVTGSRMYPAYYGFRSGETDYTGPDGWGNKLAILDKDAKEIIWSESAFKKYDWSLAMANKYGVRIVIPFMDDDHAVFFGTNSINWYNGEDDFTKFYTDPGCRATYKEIVKKILTRRNSFTGELYCDDKAVLAWQFANEFGVGSRNVESVIKAWAKEMAQYIKDVAAEHTENKAMPNVLVADNFHGMDNPYVDPASQVDIICEHYYEQHDLTKQLDKVESQSGGQKAYMVTEIGVGGYEGYASYPSYCEETMRKALVDERCTGLFVWSLHCHDSVGGYTNAFENRFSMGFPYSPYAQRAADLNALFTGKARPDTSKMIADPPIMLTRTPYANSICWFGSAGAGGYNIYRSERPDTPLDKWDPVGKDIRDDLCCLSMFEDTTAKPGVAYYYYATALMGVFAPPDIPLADGGHHSGFARNYYAQALESGPESKPSNIIGPLTYGILKPGIYKIGNQSKDAFYYGVPLEEVDGRFTIHGSWSIFFSTDGVKVHGSSVTMASNCTASHIKFGYPLTHSGFEGSRLNFTFEGSQATVVCVASPYRESSMMSEGSSGKPGHMKIYIDGKLAEECYDLGNDGYAYSTPVLTRGVHSVKMVVHEKTRLHEDLIALKEVVIA